MEWAAFVVKIMCDSDDLKCDILAKMNAYYDLNLQFILTIWLDTVNMKSFLVAQKVVYWVGGEVRG